MGVQDVVAFHSSRNGDERQGPHQLVKGQGVTKGEHDL
jgi:hypothetical protein